MIDWSIRLGDIVAFVGFVGGGLGGSLIFVFTMRANMDLLALRVGGLEGEVKKLSEIIVNLARQDERLNAMDVRMNDINKDRQDWRAQVRAQFDHVWKAINNPRNGITEHDGK